MGLREDLLRRIERKRAEIVELETRGRLAREYLQALEDTLKILPKDTTGFDSALTLRPGTNLAKAREAIKKAGRPLHINELLGAIGKGTSRNERAGLSGTLAAYVRRGEIFTRPAPNTFGLVEESSDRVGNGEPVPPAGFGKL
jgi:hypothetical protein